MAQTAEVEEQAFLLSGGEVLTILILPDVALA
jgi:hypothetical protein